MFFQFVKSRKISMPIAVLLVAMFLFSLCAVLIFSTYEASARRAVAGMWGAIKAGENPWGSGSSNNDDPPPPPPMEVPMCACNCGHTTPMCPCP